MFKNSLFLGITAGIAATIACLVYTSFYFEQLVDFSEAFGLVKMLSTCMLFTVGASFVHFGLHWLIKKVVLAELIFNLLVTLASIGAVFYVLKSIDPVFKNEDAQLMIDYYKGFVMPMLFFPALGWFTFKPLFFKKS